MNLRTCLYTCKTQKLSRNHQSCLLWCFILTDKTFYRLLMIVKLSLLEKLWECTKRKHCLLGFLKQGLPTQLGLASNAVTLPPCLRLSNMDYRSSILAQQRVMPFCTNLSEESCWLNFCCFQCYNLVVFRTRSRFMMQSIFWMTLKYDKCLHNQT